MYKSLKFLYGLGVRHERVRIASHLQMAGQQARTSNDAMLDMMRDPGSKPVGKNRKQRLEFDIAVNDRVQTIINEMFDSKGDWIPGASLMFPDDEHKGKVK